MPPREQYRQYGGSQHSPFDGSLDNKERQYKEEHDKSAHIYRTTGARLLTPILPYLLVYTQIHIVGMLHGCLII